jgi:cystathionine beta-lyase/cystathionine gamma-synthase
MKEYQQKTLLKRFLYSQFSILVLAIICIIVLRAVIGLYQKYDKLNIERNTVNEERHTLEKKLATIQAKNDSLATESGQESYIRTTYPVVKDGEGVIVIYEATNSPVVEIRSGISFKERALLWFKAFFASN